MKYNRVRMMIGLIGILWMVAGCTKIEPYNPLDVSCFFWISTDAKEVERVRLTSFSHPAVIQPIDWQSLTFTLVYTSTNFGAAPNNEFMLTIDDPATKQQLIKHYYLIPDHKPMNKNFMGIVTIKHPHMDNTTLSYQCN